MWLRWRREKSSGGSRRNLAGFREKLLAVKVGDGDACGYAPATNLRSGSGVTNCCVTAWITSKGAFFARRPKMWSDSACDAMRVCYRPHNTGVTIAPKYTKTNFVARRRRLVLTAAPATAQRIAIPGGLLSNVTSGRSHNQLRMERLRRQIRERIECNPPGLCVSNEQCYASDTARATPCRGPGG